MVQESVLFCGQTLSIFNVSIPFHTASTFSTILHKGINRKIFLIQKCYVRIASGHNSMMGSEMEHLHFKRINRFTFTHLTSRGLFSIRFVSLELWNSLSLFVLQKKLKKTDFNLCFTILFYLYQQR